jgi:hypothetical protein
LVFCSCCGATVVDCWLVVNRRGRNWRQGHSIRLVSRCDAR